MRRFWDKVEKTDGCWEWRAYRTADGYGIFSLDGQKVGAHRVAYMLEHGDIPDGNFVLHECDNPSCVNPDHLKAGTACENTRDRERRKRHPHKGKNHWSKQYPEAVAKGEVHPRAKLTETDVLAIRARWPGESMTSLGREFGVSTTQIGYIVHRKGWTHI